MQPKILVNVYLLLMPALCSLNLITDQGFQIFNTNLTSSFTNGSQLFAYRIMPNSQSNWYSAVSGGIVVRQKQDRHTTVIDTVNFNGHDKICQDFHVTDSRLYQLSLVYLLDQNCNMARLAIQFNSERLYFGDFTNNYPRSVTFDVYLSLPTNTLCFQGWKDGTESAKIGVLVDNVTLIPYQTRYVTFSSFVTKSSINHIQLVSNQTVLDESQIQLFRKGTVVSIPDVSYTLENITKNQHNCLLISLQYHSQYASSTSKPSITLPQLRNNLGQLIIYVVSTQNLPRWFYSSASDRTIVESSQFYMLLLAKIINICFRVIKIISFAYLGTKFWGFFYLGLFLSFLDIQFIYPTARNLINQLAIFTINKQTIQFFRSILGFGVFDFGSSYIQIQDKIEQTSGYGLSLSEANITTNFYSLIIDDFSIALFNTIKILVLYFFVFKNNRRFRKILKPIKNDKVLIQYITICSVIIFGCFRYWGRGGLVNYASKINLAIGCVLIIFCLFLAIVVFLSEWNYLIKIFNENLAKNKGKKLQSNEKIRNYYKSCISLSFVENIMFVIIPGFVGFGHIYACLTTTLLLVTLKILFTGRCLKYERGFLHFIQFIACLLQFILVLCYYFAHLFVSFPSLSPTAEIAWLQIIKYNSIGLVFLYVSIGCIQLGCNLFRFIRQFQKLQYSCPVSNNKVENVYQSQIKLQQAQTEENQLCTGIGESGIKVINNLRNRVQKCSELDRQQLQQIQNPFKIQSKKTITFREVKQDKRNSKERQQREKKNLHILIKKQKSEYSEMPSIEQKMKQQQGAGKLGDDITTKNIEPEQQGYDRKKDEKKRRAKSAYEGKKQKSYFKQKKKKESLKLIKKLDVSKPRQDQTQFQGRQVNNRGKSTFQIQENFT